MSAPDPSDPLSPDGLEAALRKLGDERYHHRHPFNLRMHAGTLTRRELQVWALNRYYYQTRIPVKDGAIVAKAQDPAFRRDWVQRIRDHDGERAGEGGLELWLRMAEAVGCERDAVEGLAHVLPGVRRACDAYVEFVHSNDLLASVAASLTEMFAGDIMHERIAAFEQHYDWVEPEGLNYFRTRTTQAPRDASSGLEYVKQHASTFADQQRCLAALERKCEILWSLLDAVERACSTPRLVSHAQLRADPGDGEAMVVLPERALKLGGSGEQILSLCDGTRSGEQVAEALRTRHGAPGESGTIEADVHGFLEEMEKLGVVVFTPTE